MPAPLAWWSAALSYSTFGCRGTAHWHCTHLPESVAHISFPGIPIHVSLSEPGADDNFARLRRGRCVSMHPSISLQRFHCFKGVLLLRIIRFIPYMVQRDPTFTSHLETRRQFHRHHLLTTGQLLASIKLGNKLKLLPDEQRVHLRCVPAHSA